MAEDYSAHMTTSHLYEFRWVLGTLSITQKYSGIQFRLSAADSVELLAYLDKHRECLSQAAQQTDEKKPPIRD